MTHVRQPIISSSTAPAGRMRTWWGELSSVTRALVVLNGAVAAGVGALAATLRLLP